MTTLPEFDDILVEAKEKELRDGAEQVMQGRRESGLEGLTGDLEFIIINTEQENQQGAVAELLRYTGFEIADAFEDDEARTCVLKCPKSADILVRWRKQDDSPFLALNVWPKTAHAPHTRLETLVFSCRDIDRYCAVQQERGVRFLTGAPVDKGNYRMLQTVPSRYTGNSTGVVAWRGTPGNYRPEGSRSIDWTFDAGPPPWKKNIGTLDHIATRLKAAHRTPAILEFMELTSYGYSFAMYVPALNSITNVSRLKDARFALVFTSGIEDDPLPEAEGPTEMFVRTYGARAHHMAFLTEEIDATDEALRRDGLEFLASLVGSEASGIKQSFTVPSPHTLLVTEYIKRYNGFDGYFTQENVAQLTRATANQ